MTFLIQGINSFANTAFCLISLKERKYLVIVYHQNVIFCRSNASFCYCMMINMALPSIHQCLGFFFQINAQQILF